MGGPPYDRNLSWKSCQSAWSAPAPEDPVIAGPAIEGPVIDGPAIEGPAMAGPVIAGPAGDAALDAEAGVAAEAGAAPPPACILATQSARSLRIMSLPSV